jgi:hypothetical protein
MENDKKYIKIRKRMKGKYGRKNKYALHFI